MLKERGFDPDQWEIQSLTVNQWEAPDVDGGKRLMEQTKATLKQKPQFLGELISSLGSLKSLVSVLNLDSNAKKRANQRSLLFWVITNCHLQIRTLTELSHSFLSRYKTRWIDLYGRSN